MIIHTVLVIVINMVKVVWVLVPTTLSPKKLIILFLVVILCHIRVGIFNILVINKNVGPIINHVLVSPWTGKYAWITCRVRVLDLDTATNVGNNGTGCGWWLVWEATMGRRFRVFGGWLR